MRGCDRFGGGTAGGAGNGIGGGTADGGPDTSVESRRSAVVAAIATGGNGGGRVVEPARAIGDATSGGRVMLAARIAVPGGRVGLGTGRPPGGRVGLGSARPLADTPPLPGDGVPVGPDWLATPRAPGAPNRPTGAAGRSTGGSTATLENGAALIGDGAPVGRDRVGPENADGAGPDGLAPPADGGVARGSRGGVDGPRSIDPLTSTVPVSVGPLLTPFGRPGGGAVGGFVRGATRGAGALAPMIGFAPVTRPGRAGGGGGGTEVAPLRVLGAGARTGLAPVTRPARPGGGGGGEVVGAERGVLAVAVGTPLVVRPDAGPASGRAGAAEVARAAPSWSVSASADGSSQPAES